MSIVSDGNGSVYVEYNIPNKIRDLMDIEFLREFRNQLYRIFDYWGLDIFDEEGISMNTSTAGWAAALGKACINTHKEIIYAYWKSLPYYDSDIFDGELANILLKEKLVLGSIEKYVEEFLNIKPVQVKSCCDCYGWFNISEGIELSQKESEDEYLDFRCNCCNDLKLGKIEKKEAKPIDLIERIKPYIFDIISKDLSIDKENLVKCSKCGHIYTKDLGVFESNEFLCHFCNDLENSEENNTHATDYYKNLWKELDAVDWSIYSTQVEEIINEKTNGEGQ